MKKRKQKKGVVKTMVLLNLNYNMMLIIITISFITAIALAILYNFPWILKYYKPVFVEYKMQQDEKILIVSDLHFDPDMCNFNFLENVLNDRKINTLVIAGDLLEFHKRISIKKAKELFERCFTKFPESHVTKIFITLSHASHDPIVTEEINFVYRNIEIKIIPGFLKIDVGKYNVYISHGDYFCRNGAIAGVLNKVLATFGRILVSEKILKRIIKAKRTDWVIAGHTHIFGLDNKARVANPGAWHKHVGREATHTGILLDARGPTLIKI